MLINFNKYLLLLLLLTPNLNIFPERIILSNQVNNIVFDWSSDSKHFVISEFDAKDHGVYLCIYDSISLTKKKCILKLSTIKNIYADSGLLKFQIKSLDWSGSILTLSFCYDENNCEIDQVDIAGWEKVSKVLNLSDLIEVTYGFDAMFDYRTKNLLYQTSGFGQIILKKNNENIEICKFCSHGYLYNNFIFFYQADAGLDNSWEGLYSFDIHNIKKEKIRNGNLGYVNIDNYHNIYFVDNSLLYGDSTRKTKVKKIYLMDNQNKVIEIHRLVLAVDENLVNVKISPDGKFLLYCKESSIENQKITKKYNIKNPNIPIYSLNILQLN